MFDRENAKRARDEAIRELQTWRPEDVATTAGALSLMPENAHHQARLETLSFLAGSAITSGTRRPDRSSLKRLMAHLRDWASWGDDAFGTTHTAAASFFGGTYTFLPSDAATICALQHVFRALPLLSEPSESLRWTVRTLVAVCRVSSELCKRCDLGRYEHVAAPSSQVQLPTEVRLRELRRAVTFERRDLEELIEDAELIALAPIIGDPEPIEIPLDPFMQDEQPIERRPIIKIGDKYIVYAPRLLDRACLHFVWEIAGLAGWLPQFAQALHAATGTYVDWLFRLFGATSAHPSPAITLVEGAAISQFGYQIDRDKVILVNLVTESPCNGRPIGSTWSARGLHDFLKLSPKRRRRPILGGSVGSLLEIDLILPTTRQAEVDFDVTDLARPPLVMKVDELEAIVLSEAAANDALLLWKFAEHRASIKTTEFFAWEVIDLYSIWHRRDRDLLSMVGHGEQLPHLIHVETGMGRQLRERAANNADVHGEASPQAGGTVEFIRAERESPLVYVSLYEPWRFMIVECGRMHIWIAEIAPESFALVRMIARALGYWIRYFRQNLSSFRTVTENVCSLTLRIDPDSYQPLQVGPHIGMSSGPSWTIQSDGKSLRLRVHDNFWRGMGEDTNASEVRLVCEVLRDLFHVAEVDSPDNAIFAQMISLGMRSPKMRMLHSFDTRRYPELTQKAFVPSMRRIQQPDILVTRQQHGSNLSVQDVGRDPDSANASLNKLVTELHAELAARLSECQPIPTLVQCLEQVEAQLIAENELELMLESLVACGMTRTELSEKFHDEWAGFSARGTASRFLVEHVVGAVPRGKRRLSTTDFDRCLALAHEIVLLGSASDIAHFQLSVVKLSCGASGYSIDMGNYADASSRVGRYLSDSLLPRTSEIAENEVTPNIDDLMGDLELGATDEFGLSFREIAALVAELLNMPNVRGSVEGVDGRGFCADLIERLKWKPPMVERVRVLWALEPRIQFTDPPSGIRRSDLWPWKTNRAYSYVRRPLVWGFEGKVFYTAAHLWRSCEYLVRLCTEGRLKARSNRMKAVMSKIVNRVTLAFNDQVASSLERCGYRVRSRVNRFGGEKLRGSQGDLGDIDVLAFDAGRCEVWLLECKDMNIGRAPHEVHNDLVGLFIDASEKSTETKIRTRQQWIEDHRAIVAAELGVRDPSRLRVKAGLVLSRRLVSPLLGRGTLPVFVASEFRTHMALRNH